MLLTLKRKYREEVLAASFLWPSLLILVVLGLLAFSVMFVCRRGLRKAKARLDKGIFPHRKKR